MHVVIFEADTPAGKAFDVALLAAILLSVLVVMLESVSEFYASYGTLLLYAEWLFTILFTIEYGLRIASVRRPGGYIFSFFGAVDLLAILPTYLSILIPGAQSLLVIRALRLLRIFRIFKLARYLSEAEALRQVLLQSRAKITVFLAAVFTLVVIMGSAMHLVEGPAHGFSSIPKSMYWAIVTLTTVGYGDVAPQTDLGRSIAAMLMIMGYSLIVVPTGIITAGLVQGGSQPVSTQACTECSREGHDADAHFCKFCGGDLN